MEGFQKKDLCGECKYDEWNFMLKISPIFHFSWVNDGCLSVLMFSWDAYYILMYLFTKSLY